MNRLGIEPSSSGLRLAALPLSNPVAALVRAGCHGLAPPARTLTYAGLSCYRPSTGSRTQAYGFGDRCAAVTPWTKYVLTLAQESPLAISTRGLTGVLASRAVRGDDAVGVDHRAACDVAHTNLSIVVVERAVSERYIAAANVATRRVLEPKVGHGVTA